MGFGRWENTGRAAYVSSSAAATKAKDYTDVFKNRNVVEELDVKKIEGVRESRDSEENPKSNAIILGLDVTGSMGSIAHQIAKDGLGKIIEGILDELPVTDPHLLFTAIGDVYCDSTPLQASQFEADHRIIQQLSEIYVEGGGGGNETESYDLPWYFAANMTSIDCFEKRNKKGYLFTFGDEMPPAGLKANEIKAVFGKQNSQKNLEPEALLAAAEEKYHVFHVIIEEGSYCRYYNRRRGNNGQTGEHKVHEAWKNLMGNRALPLDNHKHLPELVLAAMHVSEGADVEEVIGRYQNEKVKKSLRRAFGV